MSRQAITVRLPLDTYEWLRQIAFDRRISQASVIEQAVDLLRNTPEWWPEAKSRRDAQ